VQRVEGLVECDPCRVSLLGRRLQPLLPGLPALAPPPRPREGGPRAGRQCERWCGADQARLHHLTAVFDPLPPSHPLPGMGRSTPTAVRGPRTPSPTDDGQGRRLDEPPRPGVRRARGQEVDDAVSLQVHEERAVVLPPPPGPLGHTEPLRGGGGGCRGCLPPPPPGVGPGPPLAAGREPGACLATEGAPGLGEPQRPARLGTATGGRRSVKIWRGHAGWVQKNCRTRSWRRPWEAPHGRSARVRAERLWIRGVCTWQSGQGIRAGGEVTGSVISAAAASPCHASRDNVGLSGKKRARRARTGVETKAGSSA